MKGLTLFERLWGIRSTERFGAICLDNDMLNIEAKVIKTWEKDAWGFGYLEGYLMLTTKGRNFSYVEKLKDVNVMNEPDPELLACGNRIVKRLPQGLRVDYPESVEEYN